MYWWYRFSGWLMPTWVSSSRARSRASLRLSFWWRSRLSVICRPIFMVGFRLVMASWKMMPIWEPRMACIWRSVYRVMSSPSKRMRPPLRWQGVSCKMVCIMTLLPLPDSPTMASTSPRPRSKEASRTACTSPL